MAREKAATVRPPQNEGSTGAYWAARILIDKHGTAASAAAGQRMQELLDLGDEAGAAIWADIVLVIGEMQREPRPGDALN